MSAARHNKSFAERLVAALVSHGLTDALICPGSRSSPLALALDRRAELAVHTVLDERAAGFIALGIGRVRGRAALVCCTSGSAPAHLLPVVVEANQSRIPLIVLSADRPRELQSCGAAQTVDQTHLFGRHARWFFDFGAVPRDTSTAWIETIATQAWLQAHGAEAGPVHLNVPLAEPLWSAGLEAEAPTAMRPPARIVRGATRLPQGELDALSARLRATDRGLVVCGPMDPATLGGSGPEVLEPATQALGELATTLGWPLVAEPCSQLRFCGEPAEPLIGTGDVLARSAAIRRTLQPELVLRFGQSPTSKALGQWLEQAGRGRTILVDGAGRWHDPQHSADTFVVADPILLCRDLARRLPQPAPASPSRTRWLAQWREADRLAAAQLAAATAEGLWEPGVIVDVLARLPATTQLHVASSMPIRDLDTFGGCAGRGLSLLSNRGANGIDGLLATAAGEALAAPDTRHTVLLCGDLAFLHDIGGLAAAAQLPLQLTVVVMDNGGGGIFEFLPIAAHPTAFRERFLTPQQTRPAELCAAVGAHYLPVRRREQLGDAVPTALRQSGLSVIHVQIDRGDNVTRHGQVFSRVEQALADCVQRW